MKKSMFIILSLIILSIPVYSQVQSNEDPLVRIRSHIMQAEGLMMQIKRNPAVNITVPNYNKINGYLDTAKRLIDDIDEKSDEKVELVSKFKAALNEWERMKKVYYKDKIN